MNSPTTPFDVRLHRFLTRLRVKTSHRIVLPISGNRDKLRIVFERLVGSELLIALLDFTGCHFPV